MIKKDKYFEKKVNVGGQAITLFSLDGVTWSSIKQDLSAIQERYEKQTMLYGEQITIGPQSRSRIEAKKERVTKRKTGGELLLDNDLSEDEFGDNEDSYEGDEYEDDYEDDYMIDEIDEEYDIPSVSKTKGKSRKVDSNPSKKSSKAKSKEEDKKATKNSKKSTTKKVDAKVGTKSKAVTKVSTKKVAEKKTPQKEKKVSASANTKKSKTTKRSTEKKK